MQQKKMSTVTANKSCNLCRKKTTLLYQVEHLAVLEFFYKTYPHTQNHKEFCANCCRKVYIEYKRHKENQDETGTTISSYDDSDKSIQLNTFGSQNNHNRQPPDTIDRLVRKQPSFKTLRQKDDETSSQSYMPSSLELSQSEADNRAFRAPFVESQPLSTAAPMPSTRRSSTISMPENMRLGLDLPPDTPIYQRLNGG